MPYDPTQYDAYEYVKREIPEEDRVSPDEPFKQNDVVTVLHGYGRVSPTERHWIDNVKFEGGIAKNVPYVVARRWKRLPGGMGKAIKILPDDASELDYARATGIQPMATTKFAAMLGAMDLDEVAEALGPEKAAELAEALRQRTAGKVVRDTSGRFRARGRKLDDGDDAA